MATPRKHWFRVADSMGQDPLSNDELATAIRLMAELNTRWARDGLTAEESCSIVLRPGDLMACTGSGSLARARRIVHALATHISLIVDEQGANTSIKWPKWAEFQGLTTREEGNSRAKISRESPSPPPSPPPPPQDARKKRAKPSQKAASPRESPDTPVEDWAWLVPILGGKRLLAKSTEDELRMWLDVRYDEIAARIRSEVEPDKVWDGIKAHAISAWTMYLKTRDPTQRQFYREVATRQKSAAIQALDAQLESQARASPPDAKADEIDDDDPLRFMKLGANPHAH